MIEETYWPLGIKPLEKAVSKQLTERNFIFDTISMLHKYDACEMTDKILTMLDGDIRGRIILVSSVPHGNCLLDKVAKDICDKIIDTYPNRVRYRKYKVYCQHCGAPIQTNEPHCPYCGQPYIEFKEENTNE